jgi:hypothetical protein
MTVLLRVILTVILLAVCAALVWSRPGRATSGPGHAVRDDRFPSGVRPPPGSLPESPEGMLVRRLSIGEITASHYLRAMSQLAEHDAARHRLKTPHD